MDAEIILDRLCENMSSNTLSESLVNKAISFAFQKQDLPITFSRLHNMTFCLHSKICVYQNKRELQ